MPMSTPITIGDDILDSIRDFMLLLLLNVASHQRLAQLGKQPVHPISRHPLVKKLKVISVRDREVPGGAAVDLVP